MNMVLYFLLFNISFSSTAVGTALAEQINLARHPYSEEEKVAGTEVGNSYARILKSSLGPAAEIEGVASADWPKLDPLQMLRGQTREILLGFKKLADRVEEEQPYLKSQAKEADLKLKETEILSLKEQLRLSLQKQSHMEDLTRQLQATQALLTASLEANRAAGLVVSEKKDAEKNECFSLEEMFQMTRNLQAQVGSLEQGVNYGSEFSGFTSRRSSVSTVIEGPDVF